MVRSYNTEVGWWGLPLRTASAAIVCVLITALVPPAARAGHMAEVPRYQDVAESVHRPGIAVLAEMGVLAGTDCEDGLRFCPSDGMPRWMMAVWVVRMLDRGKDPEPFAGGQATRFSDVDGTVWWAPFVERLAELGITGGCSTKPLSFCPDRLTPRSQMASFLVRAYDLPAAEPAGFSDVVADSAHAESIDRLHAAGITAGCSTEPLRFCPDSTVTKAQMASLLVGASEWKPPRPRPARLPGADQDQRVLDIIEEHLVDRHADEYPWIAEAWRHILEAPVAVRVTDDIEYGATVLARVSGPPPRVWVLELLFGPGEVNADSLNTFLHEMAHVWSLTSGLPARNPAAIGLANLYFHERARTAPVPGSCQWGELFADALAALTPKPDAQGAYWTRDCPGVDEPDREALAVARAASDGAVPDWAVMEYATGEGMDLERLWDDVQAIDDHSDNPDAKLWHRPIVVHQLADAFGGYCSPYQAHDSAFGRLDALRNPWRDGGCVPTAPIEVSAAHTDGGVMVHWQPPDSDGGHDLEAYVVEWAWEPFKGARWERKRLAPDKTSFLIEMPSYSGAYKVRVTAVNGYDDHDSATRHDGWGAHAEIEIQRGG